MNIMENKRTQWNQSPNLVKEHHVINKHGGENFLSMITNKHNVINEQNGKKSAK